MFASAADKLCQSFPKDVLHAAYAVASKFNLHTTQYNFRFCSQKLFEQMLTALRIFSLLLYVCRFGLFEHNSEARDWGV